MRYRLTEQEKIERLARREDQRTAAADRAEGNRSWHEKRKELAEVARAKLRRARAKARAKAEKHEKAPKITVLPHTVSKHGTPIDSTLGTAVFGMRRVVANHADRRAMGARGKVRPPRRRELPAAEARRLERNRKAWA